MIVPTTYFNNLVLTSLTEKINAGGYAGPLNGLTLMLFQNSISPSPLTTFANLVEATFSGYSRITGITWGGAHIQADGSYTILSQLAQWSAVGASGFTTNIIYGWALIDTASTPDVLLLEVLAKPIPIVVAGDGFGLVVQFNYTPPNPASYGNVIGSS
jgi:hypothetical protein